MLPSVAWPAGPAYAADPGRSRGRRYPEEPSPTRNDFQRDRDRIVHSAAFRRLEYKTQVFLNHDGDWFRTRLTHSIEVAQIARSITRALGLNEDLTEAIALAHDLGHTPFGHSGQDALNDCMREHGGFEHNLQSLRIVDALERRYARYDGLNLCFETREGILKHCSEKNARQLGDVGARFLAHTQPSLEAQVANLADEIAYSNHDIEDGLRSGLITFEQMRSVPLFDGFVREVYARYPDLAQKRVVHETIRRMITVLIEDLLMVTSARLAQYAPDSPDAVRATPALVAFSDEKAAQLRELKHFLMQHLYRHPSLRVRMAEAKRVVVRLFEAFCTAPQRLPPEHFERYQQTRERAIADYIAGMTDRFAVACERELS